MKILFLAHHKWPHVGGVEKHCERVSNSLQRLGHKVKIISEEDIKYPHIKFLGLIYVWFWLFKNRKLIIESDIIHCHDVFIWYLPFRFIYPNKKVYTTFHGWEGVYPISFKNIIFKRLASKLSTRTIAVGKYIEKYYGIKADKTIYGAVQPLAISHLPLVKRKRTIVFLGRQDRDTGYFEFQEWLKIADRKLEVKYVINDPSPEKYLKTAEYCVPAGYLSYIEALKYGCKIKIFPNNPLKKDYWDEILKIKTFPAWDKIANEYINLYNNI